MKQPRESGFVLIIVLWVVIVLSTVTMAYLRTVSLEMQMVAFQRDVLVADSLAKSGLQQAFILLREDRIKDANESFDIRNMNFRENDAYEYDGGNEEWANNPFLYEDVPFYEKNEDIGYYYVRVEDESSRFPLNSGATTYPMIQKLLELSGVEEEQAMQLAAAIIDFRDGDTIPTEGGGSTFGRDGADELSFYNPQRGSRDTSMPRFPMKNEGFSTIDELLLVPGMTPAIVYGTVSPDERRDRGRFGSNRMRRGEYLGLANLVSVYSTTININTVKQEVLEATMFMHIGEDAESVAAEWVDYRNGRDGQPYTDDDNVMMTPDNSDLDDVHYTNVNGFTEQLYTALFGGGFYRVNSNHFRVTCLADYKGIEKGYRAIVERNYIPWTNIPQFGQDTLNPEDLEQVILRVRLFEPVFDAQKEINRIL